VFKPLGKQSHMYYIQGTAVNQFLIIHEFGGKLYELDELN